MTGASDEEAILAIGREIYEAIRQKDSSRLARHLADRFVARKADGSESDRVAFLRTLEALPVEIRSVTGEHEKVHLFGDVAVVTGLQHAAYSQAGAEGVSTSAFTDVFVRRDGRWLLVLAYDMGLDG